MIDRKSKNDVSEGRGWGLGAASPQEWAAPNFSLKLGIFKIRQLYRHHNANNGCSQGCRALISVNSTPPQGVLPYRVLVGGLKQTDENVRGVRWKGVNLWSQKDTWKRQVVGWNESLKQIMGTFLPCKQLWCFQARWGVWLHCGGGVFMAWWVSWRW